MDTEVALPPRLPREAARPGAAAPRRLLPRIDHALSLALGWLLLFAVAVNIANVVARYFLHQAILGAEELQVFAMVWITFVGAALVAWRDDHLRVDVLVQRLPPAWRAGVLRAEAALLAAMSLFMLLHSTRFTWQMVELGRNSDALQVPMAIPHTGMVLGFALLSAVAALRLLRGAAAADAAPGENA